MNIDYPIWEGQERGDEFSPGKINWYNLLVGDWTKLAIMIFLALSLLAYANDTQACRDILERPCEFVEKNQMACQTLEDQSKPSLPDEYPVPDIKIPKG